MIEPDTIIWTRYGWIARMLGSQHHTGIKHTSYTGRRCEYLAGDLPPRYPVPALMEPTKLVTFLWIHSTSNKRRKVFNWWINHAFNTNGEYIG